jgi:hypothetical protein
MKYQEKIEKTIKSDNPIESLREFVISLNQKGLSKDDIYDILYQYFLYCQEFDKEEEENILGDVLDMITGWYSGKNLNLL